MATTKRASTPIRAVAGALVCLLVSAGAQPHGASYIPGGGTNPGPGDTVPAPPPGGGQPTNFQPTTPNGPSTPGPSGPRVPGQPPSTPQGGPTSPGSAPPVGPATPLGLAEVDSASWELWWNYERHRWLQLRARFARQQGALTGSDEFFLGRGERAALDRVAPSRERLAREVVPTLVAGLDSPSVDVRSSALIALAKSAGACELAGVDPQQLLSARLTDRNPEVGETAVLALGMLREQPAVELLERLLGNDLHALRALHQLEFSGPVPIRMRASAAYALGAVSDALDEYRQLRLANTLYGVLQGELGLRGSEEVAAACALALGIVQLPSNGSELPLPAAAPGVIGTREHLIAVLRELVDSGKAGARMRGQAAASLARQVGRLPRESALRRELVLQWCARLSDRATDERVRRAAVVASPWLSGGGLESDSTLAAALREASKSVSDPATRARALIALGEVGGDGDFTDGADPALTELLEALQRGPAPLRPWAALGLGIRQRLCESGPRGRSSDATLALRAALAEARSAYAVGALAIALGLDGEPSSESVLAGRLDEASDPGARGYLCLALGLLDARGRVAEIAAQARAARAQPALLSSAALALGLLADRPALDGLIQLFTESNSQTTQAGLAQALGLIGDVRAIEPLAKLAQDPERPALARAFAVVALGGIASDFELPWNAALSRRADYLAELPMLASPLDGRGALDIL